MATIKYTDGLRREYQDDFNTMELVTGTAPDIDMILRKYTENEGLYAGVAQAVAPAMPWIVVALIHTMEASGSMTRHLHNGDTLRNRTTHVPAGRPATGTPPFTWEESAIDALGDRGLNRRKDWTVPGVLFTLEAYNGWGYRLHHGVETEGGTLSPYLWAGTDRYTTGKYGSDGQYDPKLTSKQIGAAAILKRAIIKGVCHIEDWHGRVIERQQVADALAGTGAMVRFGSNAFAVAWQRHLNTFPTINLSIDGDLGPKSSEATKRVTGRYLQGDPRT
jgi:lysozyme family protein